MREALADPALRLRPDRWWANPGEPCRVGLSAVTGDSEAEGDFTVELLALGQDVAKPVKTGRTISRSATASCSSPISNCFRGSGRVFWPGESSGICFTIATGRSAPTAKACS